MTYSGNKQPAFHGNSPPVRRKKSRILLILVAIFFGLFGLLLTAVLSLELNAFRGPIEEGLYRATGVKIIMEFI